MDLPKLIREDADTFLRDTGTPARVTPVASTKYLLVHEGRRLRLEVPYQCTGRFKWACKYRASKLYQDGKERPKVDSWSEYIRLWTQLEATEGTDHTWKPETLPDVQPVGDQSSIPQSIATFLGTLRPRLAGTERVSVTVGTLGRRYVVVITGPAATLHVYFSPVKRAANIYAPDRRRPLRVVNVEGVDLTSTLRDGIFEALALLSGSGGGGRQPSEQVAGPRDAKATPTSVQVRKTTVIRV